MSDSNHLAQLSGLHQAMPQLLEVISAADCYQNPSKPLAPLAWYLGYAVYCESQWIDQIHNIARSAVTAGQSLYTADAEADPTCWQKLPDKIALLDWCRQLQDDNIMLLANPSQLPAHPLIKQGRLLPIVLQDRALVYEKMIQVVAEHKRALASNHQIKTPLEPTIPTPNQVGVSQGHYRVGAKDDLSALDNERPTQVIQLSNFQIDRLPVSNSQYLSFMLAGGYQQQSLWSDEGWLWLKSNQPHPHFWSQDNTGNWFGVGINGGFDLQGKAPVSGISQHEASAYSCWLHQQSDAFIGAIVQHEYQWEAAVRTRAIEPQIDAWEWCSNQFSPYTDYQPDEYEGLRTSMFNAQHTVLRGSSLHTPAALRRVSYRNHAPAGFKHMFSGTRLVYPPRS